MTELKGTLIEVSLDARVAAAATKRRNEAIRTAHSKGLSMRSIARAAELSPARIHQIIKAGA